METKRLILRGWNLSDLTPFLKICSRQDVMKYIDDLTIDTTPLFVNCDGAPMPW